MKTQLVTRVVGTSLDRVDAAAKVTGTARYASEYPVENVTYLYPVLSTIAKGRVTGIDAETAKQIPGVLSVLWHQNTPRIEPLANGDLEVLQHDQVHYRGQIVAAVVADSPEIARHAAEQVVVFYEEQPHTVELRGDSNTLYTPSEDAVGAPADSLKGDVENALAHAEFSLDAVYTTPTEHNNPMEPHATIAHWEGDTLMLYDSTQGAHTSQQMITRAFNIPPENVHIVSQYIGGGFGSKGTPHPNVILAALAARATKRPVKFAITRQQIFSLGGYRAPTIQHIRLGARGDGRLTAISHDVITSTATINEYVERASLATRILYAAENRRTTHRVERLDLPANSWMRAPGWCPGVYALETGIDELAIKCDIDPIDFRLRNIPSVDPESGLPFSSHGLAACLEKGEQLFHWQQRDPNPGICIEGRWRIGSGVAASTYPVEIFPSTARIEARPPNRYTVFIDATDIGTGARTVLTQIAADALAVPIEQIHLEIGDSTLPQASVAGGSSGSMSWGSAIFDAATRLRTVLQKKHGGIIPPEGVAVTGSINSNPLTKRYAMHAFGAIFAEVRVHMDTCEIRVPRLLGVFAAGRILNPKTARSQFIGGMTMGLSMALHEESILDPAFGDYVNHDLAEYHIATCADVGNIEATWIDEQDMYVNPLGAKGIGEIGIVGTAAAITNAIFHATGIRVRELPITLDKLLQVS